MTTFASMTGSPGLPSLEEQVTGWRQRSGVTQNTQQQRPTQTFAQLQQQGMARPAPPPAPTAQPVQRFAGSQQAQQARQGMLGQLQGMLAQPTRFDTEAFQQIRGAQSANLQAEFDAQRKMLDDEMARRGLAASSIMSGRFGDLLGQQSRALAGLDAELLREAAQTQMQDRLGAMQAGAQFADLAGSQDAQQFAANLEAQRAEFDQQMRAAGFTEEQRRAMGDEAFRAAQAEQQGGLQGVELSLREMLGIGELGVSQQRVEQDAQRLMQDAALQGRSLTIEEARLQAQQAQFAQSLAEQQTARLQQLGLSEQELNLRAQQLQQQAALEGRSLTLQEARLQVEQSQFAQTLAEQQATRLQQFGISTQELGLRAQQLQQQAQLEGRSLDLQQARDQAEVQLRAQQLQQQESQFGRTLSFDQARTQVEQAIEREKLAASVSQSNLDRQLRELLGTAELTGILGGQATLGRERLSIDERIAQNQLLLQLSQVLGNLSPEQVARVFGGSSQPQAEQQPSGPPPNPQFQQPSQGGEWRWEPGTAANGYTDGVWVRAFR